MVAPKHTNDCLWRTHWKTKHTDVGFGKCKCSCHEIMKDITNEIENEMVIIDDTK